MEALFTWVGIAIGALACAALPYYFLERRWRWRWQEVEAGQVRADSVGGVHRQGGYVSLYLARAPLLVRIAAFTCLLFGQMFVPGLLAGLFGLPVRGLGMVSIPGLVTAAKLYAAGFALLRREPRRAFFGAKSAAEWALWLNGIIIVGFLPLAAARVDWAIYTMPLFYIYGALSIAQAILLLVAVRRHEDAIFGGLPRAHVI
jgi:hypothetical protein